MTIADMKPGALDQMGDKITFIYGFKPPEYAVYATDKRLMIRYADLPSQDSDQRKGLAPLNPIRGEINGLIDGWRGNRNKALCRKAARYDRRVADALVVALEHDVDSAATVLKQIKQDIVDDRTSWARLEYLISALLISLLFIATVSLLPSTKSYELWQAAAAGALGAFFSIALSIRSRTVLPDLRRTSNIMDASLRVLIGFIGASVLMALLRAKVVTLGFGDKPFDLDAVGTASLFTLIIGFLAGFSERMVPDLLSKVSVSGQTSAQPQASSLPAAEAGKIAAASSAASTVSANKLPKDLADVTDHSSSDEPAPQESALDHCVCDVELQAAEVTKDNELPAASGGVASNEGGQSK